MDPEEENSADAGSELLEENPEDKDMSGQADSDSDKDSSDDEEDNSDLDEERFQQLIEGPSTDFNQLCQTFHLALKLNDLAKLDLAMEKFNAYFTAPAAMWTEYLKAHLVVTQSEAEHEEFQHKCIRALGTIYGIDIAKIVYDYLLQPEVKFNLSLWTKLVADYAVERPEYLIKFRELLQANKVSDDELESANVAQEICLWPGDEAVLEAVRTIRSSLKVKETTENALSAIEKASALDERHKEALRKYVFERTLAQNSSNEKLWNEYIDAALRRDPNSPQRGYLLDRPLDLARRAVALKPCISLNHRFLHLMEKEQYSLREIDRALARVYARLVDEMEVMVELKLDYLAYRIRTTRADNEAEANNLRSAFQTTWTKLSELYGDKADVSYEILKLWAQVEYSHLQSIIDAEFIWSQILGYPGNAGRSQLWLEFIYMDNMFNCGSATRNILRRALEQKDLDSRQELAEYYRRYERTFGDYDSIASCQQYLRALDETAAKPQAKRLNHEGAKKTSKPEMPQKRKPGKPKGQQEGQKSKSPNKANPFAAKPEKTEKKMEAIQEDREEKPASSNFKYSTALEKNKIFIKNLYPECTKEALEAIFKDFGTIKDTRLVYRFNNKFKGFAFIEYEEEAQAQNSVDKADGMIIEDRKISVAISKPPPKPNVPVTLKVSPVKRKFSTTLIPTTVIRHEVANKRPKMQLDLPTTSSTNGQKKEEQKDQPERESAAEDAQEKEESAAPKTNADFRKMFRI